MATSGNDKRLRLQWQGLTKNDTTVLKGVGITLIVLHNFFHLLPDWFIENEFSFASWRFHYFREHFSLNLYNDVGLLFAYFGHYGVQLFVFLSAYGLYTSYQNKPLHYWQFIRERIWKLWPTFFLAALFFLAFTVITTRSFSHPELYWGVVLRLSFVSNLIPENSLSVVGPWWFYSMIVQFYFLFPLLRRWFNRYGIAPLILLSMMAMAVINLFMYRFSTTGIDPMALLVGHLPLFCLGLVLAKYKNRPMPLWLFLAACVLFVLGNLYMKAWLFSQLSVTIIFLYSYLFLKQTVKPGAGILRKSLFFMGNLSMYVFAVNGFLRAPFLQQTAQQPNIGIKCLILAAFLLFVILVALLLRVTEKTVLRLISKPRKPEQSSETKVSTCTLIS